MSTPYSDVINASTVKFQDYKLDKKKIEDEANWTLRMEAFLFTGIPLFRKCRKSLSDRDDILSQFNETLDYDEIDILSDCIVIKWMERNSNDASDLESMIQDKNSAKRVNEPAMVSAKRLLISQKMEELDRKISDYAFSDYLVGVTR